MRTELIELGCETSLFLAHRQICNFTVYSTYCHGPYKVHNVSLYTHCALSIPYHATTDTLYNCTLYRAFTIRLLPSLQHSSDRCNKAPCTLNKRSEILINKVHHTCKASGAAQVAWRSLITSDLGVQGVQVNTSSLCIA